MHQFESAKPNASKVEHHSSSHQLLDQVFNERLSWGNTQMEKSDQVSMKFSPDQPEIVESFGAIRQMTLPDSFVAEKSNTGLVYDEQIYHSKDDNNTVIVAAVLHAPLATKEGALKLKSILDSPQGLLDENSRREASALIVKFGDNQYAPGNKLSDYGDAWSAPNYFVRNMEVREVDGKRMLTVDGAFTKSQWTPAEGIEKATRRFSAAFMLTPDGKIESVYLEAKSNGYQKEESAFDKMLRSAKFEK